MAQKRGDGIGQVGVVDIRRGDDGAAQSPQLAAQGVGDGVDLQLASQPGHRVVVGARRIDEVGQRSDARGIDEQAADFAQCVVAGGARHRQAGVQRFVDGEDLLDDDPCLRSGDLPQPRQIARRVGQTVGVIDAHSVDESLGEPALDLHMGGVENRTVFLTETGQ